MLNLVAISIVAIDSTNTISIKINPQGLFTSKANLHKLISDFLVDNNDHKDADAGIEYAIEVKSPKPTLLVYSTSANNIGHGENLSLRPSQDCGEAAFAHYLSLDPSSLDFGLIASPASFIIFTTSFAEESATSEKSEDDLNSIVSFTQSISSTLKLKNCTFMLLLVNALMSLIDHP